MSQMHIAGTAVNSILARAIAVSLAALLLLMTPALAQAQNIGGNFGGFSDNSNKPIDIEADQLEVLDDKKIAVFSGNVKAVQGAMTMRSRKLNVRYAGDPAGETKPDTKKSGGSQITSIRAEGKVLIESGEDQSATSSWAVFDVIKQTVTLGGEVTLSQGGNVLTGDKLIIDLKTNRSRFVNLGDGSKPNRVRGLFTPKKSGAL